MLIKMKRNGGYYQTEVVVILVRNHPNVFVL